MLDPSSINELVFDVVWRIKIPRKIKFITWQVFLGWVNTIDKLARKMTSLLDPLLYSLLKGGKSFLGLSVCEVCVGYFSWSLMWFGGLRFQRNSKFFLGKLTLKLSQHNPTGSRFFRNRTRKPPPKNPQSYWEVNQHPELLFL